MADKFLLATPGAPPGVGPQGPQGPPGYGFDVVAKTTSYTVLVGDSENLITFNGANKTATLPASAPPEPWAIGILNLNATTLTVNPNGLQLNGSASSITLAQNQGLFVWSDGTNYFCAGQLPSSVVSVSSGTPAAGQVPVFTGTGSQATPGTPSSNSGVVNIQAAPYNAKCDAITLGDGAMTSGLPTLTSASAVFTVADVGKRVVVNNALGTNSHLYTTISAFTNSTTVTLAANATASPSATPFTYATDDLAAITSAIAAAAAGQVILIPARTGIFGTITPTRAVTFVGNGWDAVFGPLSVSGSVVVPTVAPYLRGSVVCQMKSGNDAFAQSTLIGEAVNFQDIAVYFAGMFSSTGHGINMGAASKGANGYDQGVCGFFWRNVFVFGHDGTHYGAYVLNPLLGTGHHLLAVGGGGFQFDQNSNLNPYGNITLTGTYHGGLIGALNGYTLSTTFGGGAGGSINLFAMVRPQSINAAHYVGTTFSAWGINGSSWTGHNMDAQNAVNVSLLGPDMEDSDIVIGSDFYTLGGEAAGTPLAIKSIADSLPFGSRYGNTGRRINRDGSFSLDTHESAGSSLALMNDTVSLAEYGISTDGTRQLWLPGTIRARAARQGTYSVGAALGASPPGVFAQMADIAGQVIFGTGTGTTTGAIASFTFDQPQANPPAVQLTPGNAATQALGLYVSAVSTIGFTVSCATGPTASQGISTYAFAYTCIDNGGTPGTPVVLDNFNKTNSASSVGSPQIGSAPTANAGTWGISSNLAYCPTANGASGINSVTWASGKSDCTVQALITTDSTNAGLALRVAASNSLFYTAGKGSSFPGLWLWTGGSFTKQATLSPTYASGDTVTAVLNGTTITIYVNGVQAAQITSATNQATQNHGLFAGDTAGRFDNFAVI